MDNKALILIGLCICLLFTLPMVSAANISADSDLIDNSVIGSSFDSQAISADVNVLEHNDSNSVSTANSDSIINSAAEEDGVNSIEAINEEKSSTAIDDEISPISSEDEENLNAKNVPSADLLGADGNGNSFSDLEILINQAIVSGQPLSLDRDFVFDSSQDDALINGIVISSPIDIEGNSFSISGNDLARIFVVSSDNVFLKDITFKNGKTTGSSDHDYNGGALYIQGDHVTIQNCNFTNSTAHEKGGAIYVSGDDCTLNHTVFLDNLAHDDGGAVSWYGNNGIIYDLIASHNTADGENGSPNAGTLLITGNNMLMDKLNISNSRVYNKTIRDKSVKGGAIFLTGNYCNITNSLFTNCSLESSIANSSGGAIYILGNNTNVINCNFTNNSVNGDAGSSVDNSSGGAIYVFGNNTNIVNCNFTNNSAIEDGGAIYIDGKNCTLNHTVFIDNVAHNDGGAIEWNGDDGRIYNLTAIGNYADSKGGSSKGGTLLINGSNISMDKLNVSNTFVSGEGYEGNKPIQGGAIALSGNYCNITNSIFDNCSVIYFKDDSNASGGALYIWGNNTNVINCNFTNNTASEDGGAIYIDGVNCTLNHTVFIGNVAHNDGGAIEWNGNNGRVYDLTAIGNYADSEEGYYYGNSSEGSSKGGTLVLSGNNTVLDKLNISNSRVFANHYDGPKPLQGGAVFLTGHNCNITNSVFDNCSLNYSTGKSYGGAMYIIGNNATLVNCNFTRNTAVLGAGAIYIDGSSTLLDGCNVLNNSAKEAAGIWISGKENNITNSNISYNKASLSNGGNGGGVYYQGNNNTVSYSNIDHNSAYNGANVYMVANMAGGKLIGCNITNGRAANFGGGVEWLQNSKDCLIKDCYFYNDSSSGAHGGGIHWYPGTNGQIDNCTFENCYVGSTKNGGAIYAGTSQGTAIGTIISNNKFKNCTSGTRGVLSWIGDNGLIVNNTFIDCGKSSGDVRYGGNQALQIQYGKNLQIIGCEFYNCTSNVGGTLRIQGEGGSANNIIIADCIFDNCSSAGSGGALVINNSSDVSIANCRFDNCSSAGSAGALLVNDSSSNVWIENNTFNNNSASNYGALAIQDNAVILSFVNNTFTNNTATASDGNGGAAKLKDGMNVINSTFIENSCNGSGGAIYLDGSLNVDGSSFKNNTADSGSAIYATAVTMSNSVLLENQAAFDKWENENHVISGDHITISGTFVGKDNLLNGIYAEDGIFNNVIYCGINGGGVGEGTTNTDDVTSQNSFNEVHQIVIMEVYDINGELKLNKTIYTDANGNYNFDFSLDDTVVHTVKVYHPEDTYYTGAEYTLERLTPEINISCENIFVEDVENITFKVNGSGNTPTGNITVIINDTNGNVVFNDTIPLNGSGEANITLSGLNASQYYIFANYSGDSDYLPGIENAEFNVSKRNTTVDVVPIPTIIYGSLENINITVSSPGATGNFTGNLTINITSEDAIGFENISTLIELVVDDEGKVIGWTIDDRILPVGHYTIDVVYSGNYRYNGNRSKAEFTVEKATPAVNVTTGDIDYLSPEDVLVNVTGVDGGVTPTGNVTVVVTNASGDVVYNKTVDIVDGFRNETVPAIYLPAGEYNVTVTYNGNDNYTEATGKANFTVNKIDTPINLETENITYGYEETISVNVNSDATGNVTIIIYDGDELVLNKTVLLDNAAAEITVPGLNAGNYTVHVDYSGDNNYNPSSTEAKFEVAKANATVEVHVYDIIYGDIEKLTVTCNAPGNVTIFVNGVNVTLSLEEGRAHHLFASWIGSYSGKAEWDLENLAVGTYPVKVQYNGNENYNPAYDSDEFKVIKNKTSITVSVDDIKVGQDAVINIKLTPGAAPGEITVTVDGKDYKVNHTNGKAVLKVPGLKAGKHTVTVSYPGSQNYTNSSNETTFTASKNSPKISVDPQNIKVDENEKITVYVPKDATGTVTITVNGKKYTSPVKEGKAVFSISGLKAGNYTVNARYNGDDKYLAANDTAEFTVSKVKTDISTSAPTIKVGKDGKVTVTVPKDATGKVTIEIDGKNYTAKVKDGEAVFIVSGLKVGKHPIKVYYSGDDKYESAVDGGCIKVIEDKGHNGGHDNNETHGKKANGIDLSAHATGNPVLALLLVLSLLAFIPLGRKKDDEEDEDENP